MPDTDLVIITVLYLVQPILATKKWDFLYPIDDRILVESRPCPTIKFLIQQKHPWGKGGSI